MKQYPKYKDSGVSWIGEIPEGWTAVPIYAIAKNFSKGQGITKDQVYEDGDTPCVRYGEIYSKYDNSFAECLSKTKLTEISNPSYFEYGDVLFAGTGELIEEIGKSIVYLGKEKCLAGGDIIVMKHNQTPEFLSYCLNSSAVQQQKSYGKTKLKVVHISKDKIKRVVIALPPLSEQHAIVSYLDKKTAQIDRFISEATKEIEKLNELKQAQIAHLVTHGLNSDVPMKNSGIVWIGQVPEHWEVRKMKFLFDERTEKNHPEEPILCATQAHGVIPQSMYDNRVVVVNTGFQNLKFVEVGDFVISLRSFQGGIEYAHYQGIISAAYTILRSKGDLTNDYTRYLFKSFPFIQLLKTCVKGIREGQNINYDMLKNNYLFVPPKQEQTAIVSAINSLNKRIDMLTSQLVDQINHLKELKQRIISDAVTGKIDVREVNN
ncbi:restriction endonuclease subunit S [Prevotella bivia]|jgi:probable type I restriction-modification system|uniref:restriction endonuclease subunit S n=1 Tax=Prevotella bivia TaxID=28125 RepID=UPI0007E059E5|nr:restriction endonuclease subunit S [Prevotella bivia]KXU56728.1 type I restriction modification DNA specificity domain protein [Prevotella bivia]